MRCILCLLCLTFLSCSEDDKEHQLSFEALCSYTYSGKIGENCNGDFLLHINSKAGEMKHSEALGYYVEFSMSKTFDCTILGVVCKGDFSDSIGSTINVTADIHEYSINPLPSVGGQKIVSLNNLIIN